MSDKVNEIVEQVAEEAQAPRVFEYGDFATECFQCGHKKVLHENIQGGLRFDLYAAEGQEMVIACEECGNKMKLYFQEAANPPKEEVPLTEEGVAIVNDELLNKEVVPMDEPSMNDFEVVEEVANEPVLEENKA